MRLIALILSSGIALASISASASAASNTFRATSVSASTCPVDEGPAGCGGRASTSEGPTSHGGDMPQSSAPRESKPHPSRMMSRQRRAHAFLPSTKDQTSQGPRVSFARRQHVRHR
jgi:hypothetical protein